MSDKDPPPFGCKLAPVRAAPATDTRADTFTDDFFPPGDAPAFAAPGQSLLNDMENQSLADFFSNTDPFHLSDPHAFPAALDAKDGLYDYHGDWGDFIAPATVHRVTTTLPDHAHLQHGFHPEPAFMPSGQAHHLGNTPDDLQAASTLFNTTQTPYSNGPSHSYHPQPAPGPSSRTNSASGSTQNPRPMIVTPHGHLNEQLAALLPHHAQDGTLDAQLAAHWAATNTQQQIQQHKAEYSPLLQKPTFKRSYTFGTDNSFNNPAGFSGENGQDSDGLVSRQSKHDMEDSHFLLRSIVGVPEPVISPTAAHLPLAQGNAPSDDDKSEDATSEDESSDRPAKKRRRSKYKISKDNPRNGARNGKSRKSSLIEESNKKKRASAAAQKLQRENLTEEQKRSNHILSEQKRRNLIKRGFDDLHDLVPEIRNGGLSKSSVLMEAGNFLEKLIQDNNSFWQLAGSIPHA